MNDLKKNSTRRRFLRAAAGLGALAVGGDLALGMSLKASAAGPRAAQEGCRSRSYVTVFTGTLTHPSVSRTLTRTYTATPPTRTSGTRTLSNNPGFTASETLTHSGPPPYSRTNSRSTSVAKGHTVRYTYSYGPTAYTVTEIQPRPYTISLTETATVCWWEHAEDCDGQHGDGPQSGSGEDGSTRSPVASHRGLAPIVDVTDAPSRWPIRVLPRFD